MRGNWGCPSPYKQIPPCSVELQDCPDAVARHSWRPMCIGLPAGSGPAGLVPVEETFWREQSRATGIQCVAWLEVAHKKQKPEGVLLSRAQIRPQFAIFCWFRRGTVRAVPLSGCNGSSGERQL